MGWSGSAKDHSRHFSKGSCISTQDRFPGPWNGARCRLPICKLPPHTFAHLPSLALRHGTTCHLPAPCTLAFAWLFSNSGLTVHRSDGRCLVAGCLIPHAPRAYIHLPALVHLPLLPPHHHALRRLRITCAFARRLLPFSPSTPSAWRARAEPPLTPATPLAADLYKPPTPSGLLSHCHLLHQRRMERSSAAVPRLIAACRAAPRYSSRLATHLHWFHASRLFAHRYYHHSHSPATGFARYARALTTSTHHTQHAHAAHCRRTARAPAARTSLR